ncbi:enolase-like domain-containing protein [Halocatena halophila]|uniref:hypothetical protein n=1 Tax=Halocatena halophila TaxID=2814576 RepID=UPI002ED44F87
MTVSVSETELHVRALQRRMPFHFGGVEATAGPQVLVGVTARINGETASGQSMGALAPMWFYKDPSMSLETGIAAMIDVFSTAASIAERTTGQTVFAFWQSLYDGVQSWATGRSYPPLLWRFGVSLLEQAVIDAYCRRMETPFPTAVHENDLGIDLGVIYDELEGIEPTTLLPDAPVRSTAIRHTVGLSDPLDDDDLTPEERLEDGRPQTLAEYVRTDGVTHFKIKLAATDADAQRLGRIHAVLESSPIDEYVVTLDANEGYSSARAFKRQYRALSVDPAASPLLDRVKYVEQPLARDESFTDETASTFADWDDRPAVIIDESDDSLTSVQRALDVGYDGTSHKNCKGVFNGIANRCLLAHRRRRDGRTYVMSGEDLTTLGPIEREQDLAVMATLGMDHVERNGHHYYLGLSAFGESTQQAALSDHPDLYRRHEQGFVTLNVQSGSIQLDSVLEAPFGRTVTIESERCTPVDSWHVDSIVHADD